MAAPVPNPVNYIRARATQLGLDPAAVLAIAGHEGLSGGVGDNGTSFGPFQLHRGGALPGSIPLPTANQWAWSPAGLNYALDHIASVAKGLRGRAAIEAISRRFERPANPAVEIADALSRYGKYGQSSAAPPPTPFSPSALPAPQRQGLAPDVLALLNKGNAMFGLAPLPASLVAPPPAAPQTRGLGLPTPKQPQTLNSETIGKFKAPVVGLTSVSGEHPTEGLPGYPAHDFFAPSGSPVAAPITGRVIKLSGHDPRQGPVEGPHGPLGWSVYIKATDGHIYYLTHMGSRAVHLGQTVKAGQRIGTVADYAKYGTPSHIHMGVH